MVQLAFNMPLFPFKSTLKQSSLNQKANYEKLLLENPLRFFHEHRFLKNETKDNFIQAAGEETQRIMAQVEWEGSCTFCFSV